MLSKVQCPFLNYKTKEDFNMGTLIALDKDLIWVNGGSGPTPPEPDIPDGTTAIPINDGVIWQKCWRIVVLLER